LTNTVFTKGGVIALSFNSDGTKIAVLGGTNVEVTLAIYDWKKNLLLAQTKAETQEAYFVGWNLVDQTIATGYLKSCKFFSYENGALSSKKAVFGNLSGTSNSILSIAYDNKGNAFIGASDGNLYLFKGNRVEATYEAHKGPVHTVSKSKGGLLSGGKDGNVVLWKQNENGKIVKLHTYAMGGPVRSVLASKTEDEVCYVLLFSGQMYRVEYSGFDNTKTLIMNSHQSKVKEELWALAVIPGQDVILSGADDGRILVWNASSKKCLNDIAAPNKPKIRSIAVSPGYEVGDIHVAVGTFDGWLHVYSAADLLENPKAQPLISKEVGKKEEIAAMAYSPNGSYLAVASHDNFTYILKAEEDYKRKAVLSGHSSFVKAVDWSDDGQYLQTTCGAHELLYWEATTFQLHQSPELANVNWHNQTVALGWSVRGIWDANMDGSDINSIHVSQNLGVIACGDDRSHVRLVKYPTITTNPVKVDYQGHCSHVTNVRFSSDSTKLYSAGGADLSVIQWKVT
jgi:WD40 repeat protein